MLLLLEFFGWMVLTIVSIGMTYQIGIRGGRRKELSYHFLYLILATAFVYLINFILPIFLY